MAMQYLTTTRRKPNYSNHITQHTTMNQEEKSINAIRKSVSISEKRLELGRINYFNLNYYGDTDGESWGQIIGPAAYLTNEEVDQIKKIIKKAYELDPMRQQEKP